MKSNQTIKSSLVLMLVAFIWGFAFVGQKAGTEYLGPFFFIGARMMFGAISLAVLLCFGWIKKKRAIGDSYERQSPFEWVRENKLLFIAGCSCGLVLFLATSTQQIALFYSTASKAGFLTTLYIVIVPIMGVCLKKVTHWNTWVSVLIAVIGLYFLTVTESLKIDLGDSILILGAFMWALHIIVIDHFCPKVNVVQMSLIQFVFVMIMGFLFTPFFDHVFIDHFTGSDIVNALPSLLWVGVISSGVAFTLQAIGQKGAHPSAAAIILSFEAVFSLVGGFLILGERFTSREWIGCALMFVAVILAQIPVKSSKK